MTQQICCARGKGGKGFGMCSQRSVVLNASKELLCPADKWSFAALTTTAEDQCP
ncbi:MAG: hypothetical protein JWN53_1773, partial [Gemmatimonadetes bacterium]|nr:hypothetical protein [Gemmatimonadota bacterium]